MGGLTKRQEDFCNYYIECGNASEAYRLSYSCKNTTSEVIHVKACELLKNGKVSVRINQLKAELKEKSDIKKEEAVKELANIVRMRIPNIVNIEDNKITIKDFSDLPDEYISTIKSIKQVRDGIEVTLYDKISAIDRLSKMLGWDTLDEDREKSKLNLNISVIDQETANEIDKLCK